MIYSKDNYAATLRRIMTEACSETTVCLARATLKKYNAGIVDADSFVQACCLYCNERDKGGGYNPSSALGDLFWEYTDFGGDFEQF